MFCPRCGKKNDDKAMFCEQCGENLKENNQNVRVNNNSKVILIICGVCFIGIISVCIFMIFKNKNDFQFSELSLKHSETGYSVYLKGKIKNNSNKNCSVATIYYEYGNGKIMEEDFVMISDLNKGEIRTLDERTFIDENEDVENYEVNVKEVRCIEFSK